MCSWMRSFSQIGVASVLGLRVAYGVGLVIAPARLSARWLGPVEEPTSVALRGLGAREVVLHGVALASALRGGPVRVLLAASAVGDLTDIAATIAARGGLPQGAAAATVLVAGSSAAISIGLAAQADV